MITSKEITWLPGTCLCLLYLFFSWAVGRHWYVKPSSQIFSVVPFRLLGGIFTLWCSLYVCYLSLYLTGQLNAAT